MAAAQHGQVQQLTERSPVMRPICRLLLSLLLLTASGAQAVTLIAQTFATNPTPWNTGTGWYRGGTTAPAVNTGWLRLTGTATDSFGYVFYNTAFSVNQGFVIDFEFLSWGGSGADGLTLFLFNGAVTSGNFRIGDEGGSLGYANGCNNDDGMESAYLGVAFDEFGNFANPADRCKSGGPGAVADAVTLRGAGDYTTGAVGTNYAYLAHGVGPTSIDCPAPACTTRPAVTSSEWRHARITMLKSGSTWSTYVDVQFGAGQPFTRVVNPTTLPSPPYTTLKLGFAASTGGSTNYHEIRNVLVTNPVDTTLTKTVSAPDVVIPGAFSYTLNVSNTNITAAANVEVTDTLPAQVQYQSYSITPAGGSCSFATPTLTCAIGSMAISTTKTITVNVTGQTQGTATNTAVVDQDDIDVNPNNNIATAANSIWNTPSLLVMKSATNGTSNITGANPGSNIVYVITVTNSGGPSKSNQVDDAMSPFTALDLNYVATGQPFQFIAGSSGLTMGTPVYSNNNGSTWTYTPVSGGGGAPAGYDGAVTNFRIPLTGTMSGAGANYILRYNTRIE